jgi:glycosyltransferase involved in cell wall biosynthesis
MDWAMRELRGMPRDVTVIVPVYNAMPYLVELFESLAAQDIGPDAYDVIAINDGSTDEGPQFLDDFCRRHENFSVVHQENSGRPGGPRNVGLRRTTARYVFFADADDRVGPECLRRLVAFADTHTSDVVIAKMVPLGGRGFPASAFEKTVIDADLPTAFQTLFVAKLYRRQMLVDHDIWYHERTRPDDGIFNAHVYMHARRISIATDYEYYFYRERQHGSHLMRSRKDPRSYTEGIATICRIVRDHLDGAAVADQIVLDLYRRKCLETYDPRLFRHFDETTQKAWVTAHQSFVERFITPEMEQRLDSPYRERSHFVRRGDLAGLIASGQFENAPQITAIVSSVRWTGGGLEVGIEATIEGRLSLPLQLICELRAREDIGTSAFPVVQPPSASSAYGEVLRYNGILPVTTIDSLAEGTYDVHLISLHGRERLSARVNWGTGVPMPPARAGFRFYPTKRGHVGIKKAAPPHTVIGRLTRFFHKP